MSGMPFTILLGGITRNAKRPHLERAASSLITKKRTRANKTRCMDHLHCLIACDHILLSVANSAMFLAKVMDIY